MLLEVFSIFPQVVGLSSSRIRVHGAVGNNEGHADMEMGEVVESLDKFTNKWQAKSLSDRLSHIHYVSTSVTHFNHLLVEVNGIIHSF